MMTDTIVIAELNKGKVHPTTGELVVAAGMMGEFVYSYRSMFRFIGCRLDFFYKWN